METYILKINYVLNAQKWSVNTHKIGIMAFSSAYHLNATAGTHFDYPVIENQEGVCLGPDFYDTDIPCDQFYR